jgi:hypothetical protein
MAHSNGMKQERRQVPPLFFWKNRKGKKAVIPFLFVILQS